jgi:GH15 family glucan-1,4-alpha-glucosidase
VLAHIAADGTCSQAYDDVVVRHDASALLAVVFGLVPRRDPRRAALVHRTIAALEAGSHLYRYEPDPDDGFGGIEGAFVPASWWAVEALAVIGDRDAALRRADDLCGGAPRLLSEEVDPATGASLGNTPLVWSHTQLAHALYVLDATRRPWWRPFRWSSFAVGRARAPQPGARRTP